jgi:hypothetical protein
MTLEEMDKDLANYDARISLLVKQRDELRELKRKLRAKAFIDANGITKSDVELSEGDGKPYFMTVGQFTNWLKSQPSHKRFAEWNTIIYFTTDVLTGRMPEMPATIRDLA